MRTHEETQRHPFDDAFVYRHFVEWCNEYALDTEEWQELYDRIHNLLCEEPNLIDDHSWSEINLLAS